MPIHNLQPMEGSLGHLRAAKCSPGTLGRGGCMVRACGGPLRHHPKGEAGLGKGLHQSWVATACTSRPAVGLLV